MDKEQEIQFLQKHFESDSDFKTKYTEYHSQVVNPISFEATIKEMLDYCFYSEFNPYLDQTYQDITWLKHNDKIYNIDDMFDVYKNNLQEDIDEMKQKAFDNFTKTHIPKIEKCPKCGSNNITSTMLDSDYMTNSHTVEWECICSDCDHEYHVKETYVLSQDVFIK